MRISTTTIGTVRLIGDIEPNARSLSKGVFYGMVDPEMVSKMDNGWKHPATAELAKRPNKIVPVESSFNGVAPELKYNLKPYSLTIFRIGAAK